MSAGTAYAQRFERTLLADPGREREVFTVARARGELAPAAAPSISPGAALAEACFLPLRFAVALSVALAA